MKFQKSVETKSTKANQSKVLAITVFDVAVAYIPKKMGDASRSLSDVILNENQTPFKVSANVPTAASEVEEQKEQGSAVSRKRVSVSPAEA